MADCGLYWQRRRVRFSAGAANLGNFDIWRAAAVLCFVFQDLRPIGKTGFQFGEPVLLWDSFRYISLPFYCRISSCVGRCIHKASFAQPPTLSYEITLLSFQMTLKSNCVPGSIRRAPHDGGAQLTLPNAAVTLGKGQHKNAN